MGNVLKKSALKKIYLQCFTVFFKWWNDYYCANRAARSKIKNYILRTAQETITNVYFFILSFSLWGKFGERQNKPVTHCITQPSQLFQLLEDPVNAIHSVRICSEDVMELVVTKNEDEYQRSFKQNVFIAAFTTSLARLKLYDALDF